MLNDLRLTGLRVRRQDGLHAAHDLILRQIIRHRRAQRLERKAKAEEAENGCYLQSQHKTCLSKYINILCVCVHVVCLWVYHGSGCMCALHCASTQRLSVCACARLNLSMRNIYIHIYASVHVHSCKQANTHIYTYMYTYTYTSRHAYTHQYTYNNIIGTRHALLHLYAIHIHRWITIPAACNILTHTRSVFLLSLHKRTPLSSQQNRTASFKNTSSVAVSTSPPLCPDRRQSSRRIVYPTLPRC